jgi:hypothetical protein
MTTNTKENITMNTYTVTDKDGVKKTVEAAYFQEEGRFVVFKDSKHAACFMISSDAVVSVRRIPADV